MTETHLSIWTPPQESHLSAVRLAATETQILTQQRYLELMIMRLKGLIQHWMHHYQAAQKETETLLDTALTNLEPNQFRPHLSEPDGEAIPLATWRQAWAETLVIHNPTLLQRLNRQEITFPVTAIADQEEQEQLLLMFQDSEEREPNLEEWLMTLATKAEMG